MFMCMWVPLQPDHDFLLLKDGASDFSSIHPPTHTCPFLAQSTDQLLSEPLWDELTVERLMTSIEGPLGVFS